MDAVAKADALQILQFGRMEIDGVLPWSSNYAFLVTVCIDDLELRAVYKPRRGERPLWDFPRGTLCLREQAAFLSSELIGWNLVPPTVLREGRHGLGSVQLYIDHDPDQHYFSFEGDPLFRTPLQRMALLDFIMNNADRKGGHVIIEQDPDAELSVLPEPSQLWGIDHGICFHEDYKLRTVIWEFAGEPIPEIMLSELEAFSGVLDNSKSGFTEQLVKLLSEDEITAMRRRAMQLTRRKQFPSPGPGRHYPWPPV